MEAYDKAGVWEQESMAIDIAPNLLPISDKFDGLLLDAAGVFWGGIECGVYPGSREIMEQLVDSGKIVGILSNSTQLAHRELDKLSKYQLVQGKHFHFLLTSGEVARHIFLTEALPFATPTKKFWVLGGAHPRFASHEALFKGTVYSETSDIREANFVYISIPHINGEDQTDPEVFRSEVEKVKATNLPMVCANPDRFAHEGNPVRAVVRQGSIAQLYEEMGGQVFYIGKPHHYAYSSALDQFRSLGIEHPQQILMVGDNPETDIRGARRFGISSALVMHTGIMADRISHQGLEGALKTLPADDVPDYLIGKFSDDFALHPNLAKKIFIVDLPLCRVLLEDDQHYPWLFLVPRRPGVSRMMDLSAPDQLQLFKELDFAQKSLWNEFQPTQINVAAIGNKTSQLHVHIIARYTNDPAWPNTVWDHPVRSKYGEEAKNAMVLRMKALFRKFL